MANYAEYFEKIAYKPKYFIGDRVFGYWNKIPFIGTVGNDNMISEIEGPRVSIFLDLPIQHENKIYRLIFVKQNQIKRLKNFHDIPNKKH